MTAEIRESNYAADKTTDVLVVEAIGRTRYRTPDGFLYCEGVRIASTKPLLYRADEMRKCRPQHGMVLMDRPAEVLFAEDTVASFNGKPITNDHPSTLVGPKQWKRESVGVVLNPRPGTGDESEFLIADMLITDERAIDAVEKGKIEVSCGYDQDHAEIKPGWGKFTRITGNHVALVEKGRCGPQCAIGDTDMTTEKKGIFERLRTAFASKDEKIFDSAVTAAEEAFADDAQRVVIEVGTTSAMAADTITDETVKKTPALDMDAMKAALDTALAPLLERIDKLEFRKAADEHAESVSDEKKESEKEEKKEECTDEETVTADADALDAMSLGQLRIEFQEAVGRAEILSPGIKLPTFDATCNSKKTIADQMCGLRKAALDAALADNKRAEHVTRVLGREPDTSKMSCDQLTMAFNAASEIARMANNAPKVAFDHKLFPNGPMTAAKLQEINAASRRKAS